MQHWANNYVGKPWVSGGRGPESFDCWGLLVWVYAHHYGRTLPEYAHHDATSQDGNRRLFQREKADWQEVLAYKDGDAVAISAGKRFHHVGVYLDTDGGLILHACQGKGVLAQTPAGLRTFGLNNLKFYRHKP